MAREPWTDAHVRRLFWRAGFGARPDEARHWAGRGKEATIAWLVSGGSGANLHGPAPTVDGQPLDPVNEWGHDVLWWLDRMVRSERPLEEKMTLFWHDHFATRDQETPLMLRQNRMLRKRGLGAFPKLLQSITLDPAMQLFLSLADSHKDAPNENFARELMELFTLGRGYTENDIREAARALTGFRARWGDSGFQGIRFDRSAYDAGVKRIFRRRGRFGWRDTLALCTSHPRHAGFLVGKLWSFFVTEPLDRRTRADLVAVYRGSKLRTAPVVSRILAHPALYADLGRPDMVKSPVVFVAGTLRAANMGIDRGDWAWLLNEMGQTLFEPPSVAGWDWGAAWLSTNTMKSRFVAMTRLLRESPLAVPDNTVPPATPAAEQIGAARAAAGDPWTSPQTDAVLERMAATFFDDITPRQTWKRQPRADHLQRTLRHFLLAGPDAHLH